MAASLSRRSFVVASSMLLGLGTAAAAPAVSASSFTEIEQRCGGRLGVFAVDTGTGRSLAHRADERFLMCSTFKGLLAAQTLARVDAGKDDLSAMVPYTRSDLIFTSPITKANLTKGAMSVGDLTQAMLEYSDNTAAILLMRRAGGPTALTAFLRSIGNRVTRSDRYEPLSNQVDGVHDTTSPRAIVGSAHAILLGTVLTPASRARLEAGMVACKPGVRRIRAIVPKDWSIGDRPGENLTEESNDYAIVRPPGRAPLLIAIYCDAKGQSMAAREATIREAGAVFVQWAMGSA